MLSSTVFGRHVIAVGTNPEAARISGIDLKRTLLIVLCLSGVLAGLAGLMNAAYLGSTDPNADLDWSWPPLLRRLLVAPA